MLQDRLSIPQGFPIGIDSECFRIDNRSPTGIPAGIPDRDRFRMLQDRLSIPQGFPIGIDSECFRIDNRSPTGIPAGIE